MPHALTNDAGESSRPSEDRAPILLDADDGPAVRLSLLQYLFGSLRVVELPLSIIVEHEEAQEGLSACWVKSSIGISPFAARRQLRAPDRVRADAGGGAAGGAPALRHRLLDRVAPCSRPNTRLTASPLPRAGGLRSELEDTSIDKGDFIATFAGAGA